MNTFSLKITSPDGVLFSGQAAGLYLRSTEGDMAVLAGHAPFLGTVVPCVCKIDLDGESQKAGHTSGGLLEVREGETVLFTRSFTWDKEE